MLLLSRNASCSVPPPYPFDVREYSDKLDVLFSLGPLCPGTNQPAGSPGRGSRGLGSRPAKSPVTSVYHGGPAHLVAHHFGLSLS
jgi:hypothetical protein